MKRNCNICEAEYEAEARYVNRGQGLTCSRACGTILSGRKRQVKHEPNVQCGWCGIDFYLRPSRVSKSKSGVLYCSKEHQDLGAANFIHRTGRIPANPLSNECSICNLPLRTRSPKSGRAHVQCRQDQLIKDWLAGDNSVTLDRSRTTGLPVDTKKFVKKYLLKTRGDRCEECGFDKHGPNGSIIQMDHVNGNCFDNRPENLKLLCPNCHAMTPTYGSRNKGSGRAHRRSSV